MLVGSAAEFGEPWLSAVRETMEASALGLLARDTTIEIGRLHADGVVLGATALLMTRELGLSLAGLPPDAVDEARLAGEPGPADLAIPA